MPLTDAEKKEIVAAVIEANQVAAEAEAAEKAKKLAAKEPAARKAIGDDPADDPAIEVGEPRLLQDPKGGFKGLGHFFQQVAISDKTGGQRPTELLREWDEACRATGEDSKTQQKTAGYMEEGDQSQGGYLVPTEFRAQLMQTSLEASIVRQRATEVPMATNAIEIPALMDSDHSSNYFGGITIYRTGEGGAKTPKNPTFGLVGLKLKKLTGLCYVTDELISDSPISMEPILRKTFGESMAFVEDDDYLNGDGSNKALGAFHTNNPSLVTVTKESGQTADSVVYKNLTKMWSRLHPTGHANSVWLCNMTVFPELAEVSIGVGTGGAPAYMPSNGAAGTPYGTLMGRPLIITEKMQAVGDAGDLCLANFKDYLIGRKGSGMPDVATSIHVRFVYDETAFRFVMRYDGQPWWKSALTPKRGGSGATMSPFIRLGERA